MPQRPVNQKLKQTIMYILTNCPSSDTVGLKKLCKLLYFADFNYYKQNYQSLTGAYYLRWEHGPVPDGIYETMDELKGEGKVDFKEVSLNDEMVQNKYTPQGVADFSFLSDDERAHLDKVIQKLGRLSGTELESLSHIDTPWQVSDANGRIKYKLVFYRDDKISGMVE